MKQKQVLYLHTHAYIIQKIRKVSQKLQNIAEIKTLKRIECFKDKVIGNLSECGVKRQSERKGEKRVMKLQNQYRKSNIRLLRSFRKRTEKM